VSDPIAPLDAFPPHSRDEWAARVPADLGRRDRDGMLIAPLYTAEDLPDTLPPERPAPEWQIWMRGKEWTEDGCDPLATLPDDIEAAYDDMVARCRGDGRPVTVSTLPYHEAGAHVVEELACLLATASAYLSAAEQRGMAKEEFAQKCLLRLAVGRDVFREIAKLRAARELWRRLTSAEAFIHAVCSERTLTRVDPWTNMMRVTTQTFAAACAGVEAITPNAYDSAGADQSELGRRIAHNTMLILRHESGLGGGLDPAHGSYYIESLTRSIADSAWNRFRAMEAADSFEEQLRDGSLLDAIDHEWNEGALPLLRTRAQPVTGVSEFPSAEPPLPKREEPDARLPRRHDADPFEALRDRAAALRSISPDRPPTVQFQLSGTPREHGAAFTFARNLFLAGGFEIVEDKAKVACVCGPSPAPAVKALEDAGARRVVIAESLMGKQFDAAALLSALLDEVER